MEEPFNKTSLSNCIRGLLTEDLLSEGKQAMLKSFLDNDLALNEIADVLDFRTPVWSTGTGMLAMLASRSCRSSS